MGLFIQVVLFPGGEAKECRKAVARCADDPELALQPDSCRWHCFEKGPVVLINDGCLGYEELADRLSALLTCPVMMLFIYDGDLWGYQLWEDSSKIDMFFSLPSYFGHKEVPGRSHAIARCFDTDTDHFEQYLIPWREEEMGCYAYDGDRAVIGDCWQMADFMASLGFDYDMLCPPEEEPDQAAAPMPKEILAQEPWRISYAPIDTPSLPNAVTDRKYILSRAKGLGDTAGDAVALIKKRQYLSAVPLLTGAIQSSFAHPVLYLLRAFCWHQSEGQSARSRKTDMEQDLTKALEAEPDNIMILRALYHETLSTRRRHKLHILYLTRLMDLDPDNCDLYLVARAYRLHWTGDDGAARSDLRAVLDRGILWTVDLVYLCREFSFPGFPRLE